MRLYHGVALWLAACANGRAEPAAAPASPAALCVTRGDPIPDAAHLAVDDAVFRAVAPAAAGDDATLAFTLRGDTADTVALGSGQIRRQLGLKLRAADGCNLVYVMWRTAPRPGLHVSIKQNPGRHTHAACGTRGYRDLPASRTARVPALVPGEPHTLRAAIDGDTLTAWIDGREVWRGVLDGAARDLAGPPGVRSDNLAWDGALATAPAASGGRTKCVPAAGD